MDNGKPIGKCYKCGANLYATLGLCLSCENKQLSDHLKQANKLETIHTNQIEAMAGQIEQHRWIPVSERLPSKRGYINVAEAKLKIPAIWYWTNTNDEVRRLKAFYTHWKPIILPE